jgi:hypothetical protein
MNQQELLNLAQQLVDLKKQIKTIEDDMLQLKLEIFEDAKDGIKCNGGKVIYLSPKDVPVFDKELLKDLLRQEYGFENSLIDDLYQRSQRISKREAQLNIYLNK